MELNTFDKMSLKFDDMIFKHDPQKIAKFGYFIQFLSIILMIIILSYDSLTQEKTNTQYGFMITKAVLIFATLCVSVILYRINSKTFGVCTAWKSLVVNKIAVKPKLDLGPSFDSLNIPTNELINNPIENQTSKKKISNINKISPILSTPEQIKFNSISVA